MNIRTFITAKEAQNAQFSRRTAVVIDVLRAGSVITTALNNKAARIKTFSTVERAVEFKENHPNEEILLCGERKRVLIPGFDLGNSPLEYTKQAVSDKTLVMTTTNGTRAIEAAFSAEKLYIMSFLNLKYVSERLKASTGGIDFVCSGTEDKLSIDDLVCAGRAISLLCRGIDYSLDDTSYLAKRYYELGQGNIKDLIKESASYKGVCEAGFEKDIDFCFREDIFDTIPYYSNGFIISL